MLSFVTERVYTEIQKILNTLYLCKTNLREQTKQRKAYDLS